MGMWDDYIHSEKERVLIRIQKYDGTSSLYLSNTSGVLVDGNKYYSEATILAPITTALPMLADTSFQCANEFSFSIPIDNGVIASSITAKEYAASRIDVWYGPPTTTAILSTTKIFSGLIKFPQGITWNYQDNQIVIIATAHYASWLKEYPDNEYIETVDRKVNNLMVKEIQKSKLPIIFGHYLEQTDSHWGENYVADVAHGLVIQPLKVNVIVSPVKESDEIRLPAILGQMGKGLAGVSALAVRNAESGPGSRTRTFISREGEWQQNNYEYFGVRPHGATGQIDAAELFEFGNFRETSYVFYETLRADSDYEILSVGAIQPGSDYGTIKNMGYENCGLYFIYAYTGDDEIKARVMRENNTYHETQIEPTSGAYDSGMLMSHKPFTALIDSSPEERWECVWHVKELTPGAGFSVRLLSIDGEGAVIQYEALSATGLASDSKIAWSDGSPIWFTAGVGCNSEEIGAILITQASAGNSSIQVFNYTDQTIYEVPDAGGTIYKRTDLDSICGVLSEIDNAAINDDNSFHGTYSGWLHPMRLAYYFACYTDAGHQYIEFDDIQLGVGPAYSTNQLDQYETDGTVTDLIAGMIIGGEPAVGNPGYIVFCNTTTATESKIVMVLGYGTATHEFGLPFGDIYDMAIMPVSVGECYVFCATKDGIYYIDAGRILGKDCEAWALAYTEAELDEHWHKYSERVVTSLSVLLGSAITQIDSDLLSSTSGHPYSKEKRWMRYLLGINRKIDDRHLNVVLATTPDNKLYMSSMVSSPNELGVYGQLQWDSTYGITTAPERTAGYFIHLAEGGTEFSMNWTTEPATVDCSNWTTEIAKRAAHGFDTIHRIHLTEKKRVVDHAYSILKELGYLMYADITGTTPKLKLKYLFQKNASSSYTISQAKRNAKNLTVSYFESYTPDIKLTFNYLNGQSYSADSLAISTQYGLGEDNNLDGSIFVHEDGGLVSAKSGNQAWQTYLKFWHIRLNNYDAENDTVGKPLRIVTADVAPDIWDVALGASVTIGSDYTAAAGTYWLWEKSFQLAGEPYVSITLIEEPSGEYEP